MSQPVTCRLCLNTCDDYKNVYDVHGENSKIMNQLCLFRLLLETKANPSRVICLLCWRLLSNFNHYRESVKKALVNLRNGVRTPLKLTALQLEIVCDADQPNLNCDAEMEVEIGDISITDQQNRKSALEMHISKQDKVICAQIQSLDEPLLMEDLVTSDNSAAPNEKAPATVCCNDSPELSSATVSNAELQLEQFHKQMISKITLEDKTQSIELSANSVISKSDVSNAAIPESKPIEIISSDDSSDEFKPSIDETGAAIDYGFVVEELDDDQQPEVDTSEQQPLEYDTSISGSSGNTSKSRQKKLSDRLNAIIAKWRKMLGCYVCYDKFSNFYFLQQHFKQHHPGKQCYVRCCSRGYPNRSKLAEHARYHLNPQSFKCDLCSQTCKTQYSLKMHWQRKHSDVFDDQYQPAGTYEHEDDSSILGSSVATLKRGRKTLYEESDAIIAKWRKMLPCYVCHETYSNFMLFREHFLQHHPGKKCYIRCCNISFLYRCKLAEHARLHLNPKPYKCQLCAQTFTRAFSLKIHRQKYH